jgi:hypothetical protein
LVVVVVAIARCVACAVFLVLAGADDGGFSKTLLLLGGV